MIPIIDILIISRHFERTLIDLKQLKYILIAQQTPFFLLDIIKTSKDTIHCLAIDSIMKLKEINIIKNTKEIEYW